VYAQWCKFDMRKNYCDMNALSTHKTTKFVTGAQTSIKLFISFVY